MNDPVFLLNKAPPTAGKKLSNMNWTCLNPTETWRKTKRIRCYLTNLRCFYLTERFLHRKKDRYLERCSSCVTLMLFCTLSLFDVNCSLLCPGHKTEKRWTQGVCVNRNNALIFLQLDNVRNRAKMRQFMIAVQFVSDRFGLPSSAPGIGQLQK